MYPNQIKRLRNIVILAVIGLLNGPKANSQETTPDLLAAFPAASRPASPADTIIIDQLLDSTKAWVATGDGDRPVVLTKEVLRCISEIKQGGFNHAGIDVREGQAHKLEGVAHHYAGRYAPALKSFQGFQAAAERLGKPKQVAAAINYQAYEYRSMGETERAKTVTLRALAILDTLPEDGNLANTRSGLGTIYFDLDRLDSAFIHQRAALSIYERLGLTNLAATCRMDIAELHMKEGAYDSAYHHLSIAGNELRNDENLSQRSIYLGQLGRALYGSGRYSESQAVLAEMEPIALELKNDQYQYRAYELLALNASVRREPLAALTYLDKARAALIRDLDVAKAQELTEVRLTAEHEKEAALAAEQLAEQKRQKRNVLIGTVLLALIALLLLYSIRVSRRSTRALRTKNEELVRAQEQLVQSEKRREAEQVRTRIARDIHDDMGGELTKIRLLGGEVKHLLQSDPEQAGAAVERMARSAQMASDSLRDIVWATDPHYDTKQGTLDHARELIQRMLEGSGPRYTMDLQLDGADGPVDTVWKQNLMRILKETLNNALKHAEASRIDVSLLLTQEGYRLSVQDDGRGFDLSRLGGGNGLRNMRARAESMGARFDASTPPEGGCRIALQGTALIPAYH